MSDIKKGFQPIPNPYIVGKPILDRNMFFGRLDDFEFIRKKVSGAEKGGIIVLCGSRRSGKTSILFQIKKGRLGGEFLPVLIDMQSMTVRSDEEFLSKLVIEVISAVQDPRISFEEDFLSRSKSNPYTAFQFFMEKMSSVVEGKKLIVMFDEYELFETHIDKGNFSTDILNTLSSWMEHRRGVFLIFTGSDRLESRKTAFWERFLPKATHRRISFISKDDTFRLIQEPVRGIVSYQEGVPEEVFALTAGQPFYTQVICQSIVDHLNENQKYVVSGNDIGEVVKYIIENPLPQMIFAWNSLSDYGKFILSIMAEIRKEKDGPIDIEDICKFPERENIGYRIDSNKIRESTERLFHADYLGKKATGEKYFFKMDLWRRWITLMHSIWQVINELGSDEHELEDGIVPISPKSKRPARIGMLVIITIAILFVISLSFINLYIRSGNEDLEIALPVAIESTTVSIDTEPAGALVFVNDSYFGQTPIHNESVEAETVAVMIQMEGYESLFDTLELEKDTSADRSYTLAEKTGAIDVTSTPVGARIFIDGKDTRKTTPARLEKLSVNDLHRIVLRTKGYVEVVREGVRVSDNEVNQLNIKLSARKHPLTVESTPHGAKIYLDELEEGVTPKSFPAVAEGSHSLRLVKDGYDSVETKITVPSENDRVSIILEELLPGTLILRIIPWADLYLDGELLENECLSKIIQLKEGIHIIDLKHKDYGSFKDTVTVKSNMETTREYNLREMRKK